MFGENDLTKLLGNMQPVSDERRFVFCTVDSAAYSRLTALPLGLFRETEGVSLILEKNQADEGVLPYDGLWALITLNIHSDLSAVGFLAAVTNKLAGAGISVNPVSAYYHDHLFVPYEQRDKVLALLQELGGEER